MTTGRYLTVKTEPAYTSTTSTWGDGTTAADALREILGTPWTEAPVSKGTVTFKATSRVNAPTLASGDMTGVMRSVKHKLLKQLFEQLEASGLVKITSEKSPKNGSVTFAATFEVVNPNDKA